MIQVTGRLAWLRHLEMILAFVGAGMWMVGELGHLWFHMFFVAAFKPGRNLQMK